MREWVREAVSAADVFPFISVRLNQIKLWHRFYHASRDAASDSLKGKRRCFSGSRAASAFFRRLFG